MLFVRDDHQLAFTAGEGGGEEESPAGLEPRYAESIIHTDTKDLQKRFVRLPTEFRA